MKIINRLYIKNLPLAAKLFLICLAITVTISACGNLLMYTDACVSLRDMLKRHLSSVATTTALKINIDSHTQVKREADKKTDNYRILINKLNHIKNADPEIIRIFTIRKTYAENFKYILDTKNQYSKHFNKVSSDNRNDLNCALIKELTVIDPTEYSIISYAPIKDSYNHTQAIIGIEFSSNRLKKAELDLKHMVGKNLFFALVASLILSAIAVKAMMRPIKTFIRASQRICDGDLDFRMDASDTDEIGQLATAFNDMISSLKEGTKDMATGLSNHVMFHEQLDREVKSAGRNNRNSCILILDIDGFKSINEEYSHIVGDNILHQLASLIKQNTPSNAFTARYGGDEFAIILSDTNRNAGLAFAEKLRRKIEEKQFNIAQTDDSNIPAASIIEIAKLTTSIGLACFPEDHSTKDGLIMAADIALSNAKQNSRNSVSCYSSSIGGEEYIDPYDLFRTLKDPNAAAIQSLAAAVDAKDKYTRGHSERVSAFAVEIGRAFGLGQGPLETIRVAGLLHDLGKIGVPDSVLNKETKLTDEEWEAIKQHPAIGGQILKRAPSLNRIIPAVVHHHERWDGKGYPDGLAGNDIPLIARIMAVADAFDAMTSDRTYRKAMSYETALEELKNNVNKQFDPRIIEAFMNWKLSQNQKAA